MSAHDRAHTNEVVEAIHSVPYEDTLAWPELSNLSGNTRIDSIEVFADEIEFSGNDFEGPVVWHVTLTYGGGKDTVTMSEAFPGKVRGRLVESGTVHVDELTVDVSSFYE